MDKQMARQIVLQIARAIIETVEESKSNGAPASAIYMALAERGMSFAQFEALMAQLVDLGLIRHSNHCYFGIEEGK